MNYRHIIKWIVKPLRTKRANRLKRIHRLTDAQIVDICNDAMACCNMVSGDILREYRRRLNRVK